MKKGFYQGVNFDSAYCGDCGRHSTNVLFKCPHCGSANLSVISRVCGYLGYSNVNGMSRMNDGKMAEIRNRKSTRSPRTSSERAAKAWRQAWT